MWYLRKELISFHLHDFDVVKLQLRLGADLQLSIDWHVSYCKTTCTLYLPAQITDTFYEGNNLQGFLRTLLNKWVGWWILVWSNLVHLQLTETKQAYNTQIKCNKLVYPNM